MLRTQTLSLKLSLLFHSHKFSLLTAHMSHAMSQKNLLVICTAIPFTLPLFKHDELTSKLCASCQLLHTESALPHLSYVLIFLQALHQPQKGPYNQWRTVTKHIRPTTLPAARHTRVVYHNFATLFSLASQVRLLYTALQLLLWCHSALPSQTGRAQTS